MSEHFMCEKKKKKKNKGITRPGPVDELGKFDPILMPVSDSPPSKTWCLSMSGPITPPTILIQSVIFLISTKRAHLSKRGSLPVTQIYYSICNNLKHQIGPNK